MSSGERIPLIATDLDGTLIPGDSLRKLLTRQLRHGPGRAQLTLWALAHALGMVPSERLLAAIVRSVRARADYTNFMQSFAAELGKRLDADLVAELREAAGAGSTIVLCSASPADYVVPLARSLGWDAVSSTVTADGRVFHCYGAAKKQAILERYPPTRYRYVLSVADSASDEPLRAIFETHRVVRRDHR